MSWSTSPIERLRILRWPIRLAEIVATPPPGKVRTASATSSEPGTESGWQCENAPRTDSGGAPNTRRARSRSWISRSEATPVRIRAAYGECLTADTWTGSRTISIAVITAGL